MLLFKTPWGTYLLQNAHRVDVFKSKGVKTWDVFITIDANKHLLHSFETERDAMVFMFNVRDQMEEILMGYGESDKSSALIHLDDICKAALHETEQQGVVE